MTGITATGDPLVMAATLWADNAVLIADAFRLISHHLPATPVCIDLTYGQDGLWWRDVPHQPVVWAGDFTAPTEPEQYEHRSRYHVVAYDPPYVLQGGEPKGGPGFAEQQAKFRARYGIDKARTITELRSMMFAGCATAFSFARPGGFILAKSMPFVTNGMVHWLPYDIHELMREMGADHVDDLVHLRKTGGPQPDHERQLTARRNYSMLQIFRKPRRWRDDPQLFEV